MNQGEVPTSSIPTVTVRGVGIVSARPDGTRVELAVRHRAEAADEALREAARKAQTLESLFLELGIEEENWITTGLSLEEWTEWDEPSRREVRRGYVASSRVIVTTRDSDPLGRLLAEAVGRTEASVQGPWWHVASDNPAHEQSRREAMADASRRAETYAEAAGMGLGGLLEVIEAGAEQSRPPMRAALAAGHVLSGGMAEMPVHAEGLQVVAAVYATYLLTST